MYLCLLLIVACAANLFYLVPFWHIPGSFSVSDIGLLLIALCLVYYVVIKGRLRPLRHPFSLYIYVYLLLILVEAALAAPRYHQSVLDGLIIARHQLYYLFFPVLLMALDTHQKLERFLNLLVWVGVVLVLLSIINYSGVILYHFKWAEGQGVRSGITRAFIPGMAIIVLGVLWQFNRYLQTRNAYDSSLKWFLILLFGVFFRQTRSRILATVSVIGLMLYRNRRFRQLAVLLLLIIMGAGVLAYTKYSDVAVELAQNTYKDITSGQGTVGARLQQVEGDIAIIKQYPVLGSGGLLIRQTTPSALNSSSTLYAIAYGADLGYMSWFKYYGFAGLLLLFYQWGIFFGLRRRTRRLDGPNRQYADFAAYHYLAILISALTLNYFTDPSGVVLLTTTWAILAFAAEKATVPTRQLAAEESSQETKVEIARLPSGHLKPTVIR